MGELNNSFAIDFNPLNLILKMQLKTIVITPVIFILYKFFQIQEIPLNIADFDYNFLKILRLLNFFLPFLLPPNFPFSICRLLLIITLNFLERAISSACLLFYSLNSI